MFHSNLYQEGCIENSGKFTVLMQLIKESLSRGDKMLIFRFVSSIALLLHVDFVTIDSSQRRTYRLIVSYVPKFI